MNGFVQININGEAVGIKFGEPAVKQFSIAASKWRENYYDKTKVKIKEGEEEKEIETEQLSTFGMAKLIHCGYRNNCMIKEIEPSITLEQISDWVEEAITSKERMGQLANVLNVFSESQYVKSLAEKANEPVAVEDEETKKKI